MENSKFRSVSFCLRPLPKNISLAAFFPPGINKDFRRKRNHFLKNPYKRTTTLGPRSCWVQTVICSGPQIITQTFHSEAKGIGAGVCCVSELWQSSTCRTEDGGRTERAEASRPPRKYSETPDLELVAGRALRDRQGDPGQQVG